MRYLITLLVGLAFFAASNNIVNVSDHSPLTTGDLPVIQYVINTDRDTTIKR